ncbi:hypothetical protein CRENBAI_004284 [Crenichthys baileyi]|uniref:Uncharacterized protein n=1 Tax=Crenichthys baileyi TaxID=28760 RepID=A0AAV9RZC4_9TELE
MIKHQLMLKETGFYCCFTVWPAGGAVGSSLSDWEGEGYLSATHSFIPETLRFSRTETGSILSSALCWAFSQNPPLSVSPGVTVVTVTLVTAGQTFPNTTFPFFLLFGFSGRVLNSFVSYKVLDIKMYLYRCSVQTLTPPPTQLAILYQSHHAPDGRRSPSPIPHFPCKGFQPHILKLKDFKTNRFCWCHDPFSFLMFLLQPEEVFNVFSF